MVQQFKWNMFLLYVPKKDMYHNALFIMNNIAPLCLNSMFELTNNNQLKVCVTLQEYLNSCLEDGKVLLFGIFKTLC